jgi:hypothetical protein
MYRKLCNRIFGSETDSFEFSDIVRLYSGYPHYLPLPFNIYHGWFVEVPRPADLRHRSSLLLVFNQRQAQEWQACSDKPVAVLGAPFIHYRHLMGIQQRPDAAGTIVYPGHNATSNDFVFDTRRFCEQLASLGEEFHPITVSVLDGDISSGKDQVYREFGFRTFSPGPRRTIGFCRRFYEELAKHRYSCGNHFGTNILYAVEMGIPFFFLGDLGGGVTRATGQRVVKDRTLEQLQLLERVRELFAEPVDEVTPEQRALVVAESGMEDCLGPDELRRLLLTRFFTREVPGVFVRAAALPFRRLHRMSAQERA